MRNLLFVSILTSLILLIVPFAFRSHFVSFRFGTVMSSSTFLAICSGRKFRSWYILAYCTIDYFKKDRVHVSCAHIITVNTGHIAIEADADMTQTFC